MNHHVAAILPCTDLDAAEAFFARLGFACVSPGPGDYRILADGRGGALHLSRAAPSWMMPERSPFGLYLYREDVDAAASAFAGEAIGGGPADKPWGMYEFALNGPDGTLIRIGWPTRPR
jgi:catechol 2,3-dioxygenase-like lactoylglutathione lyase family enzyme